MRHSITGLFLFLVAHGMVSAQLVEIERNGATKYGVHHFIGLPDSSAIAERRKMERGVELFRREGAELYFSGPGQAIVQIVELHLGEPDGFNLPVYFFLSPAGDILGGEQKPNELAAATLVNPLGGAVNFSINQTHLLYGPQDRYTSLRLAYHLAGKLLTGEKQVDPGQGLVTLVAYGDVGIHFQTGAWRENEQGNLGVFWLQAKIGGSLGSKERLQELFGLEVDGSLAHWSAALGLEVDNYINLKLAVSQAIGVDRVPVFDDPLIKFAFDVTPKRSP